VLDVVHVLRVDASLVLPKRRKRHLRAARDLEI
jgi:hypothetical protein